MSLKTEAYRMGFFHDVDDIALLLSGMNEKFMRNFQNRNRYLGSVRLTQILLST